MALFDDFHLLAQTLNLRILVVHHFLGCFPLMKRVVFQSLDFLEFRLDLVKSLSQLDLRLERLDLFDYFALFSVVLVRGGLLLILKLLDTSSDLVGSPCVLRQSFDQLVTLRIKLSKFRFELLMLVKEFFFGGVELLFFGDFLLKHLLVSVLAVLHFAALFDLLKLRVQGLLLGLELFD